MFYKLALDTSMNEFTAPMILPLVLIAMILFDKLFAARVAPATVVDIKHEALVREHEQKSDFLNP